jgi:hypothetical protein
MAKKKIPKKYQPRIVAWKRSPLPHAHIQMDRGLGLNPKKFGGLTDANKNYGSCPYMSISRSCTSRTSGGNGSRMFVSSSRL